MLWGPFTDFLVTYFPPLIFFSVFITSSNRGLCVLSSFQQLLISSWYDTCPVSSGIFGRNGGLSHFVTREMISVEEEPIDVNTFDIVEM